MVRSKIKCEKCNGTGEYIFPNGVVSICYGCGGKRLVECVITKKYTAYIGDMEWMGINADTEKQALAKAKKVCMKGCYRDLVDSVVVRETGIAKIVGQI